MSCLSLRAQIRQSEERVLQLQGACRGHMAALTLPSTLLVAGGAAGLAFWYIKRRSPAVVSAASTETGAEVEVPPASPLSVLFDVARLVSGHF